VQQVNTSSKRDFWLLLFILAGLFTFGLGLRPLATPDEGRYVEIPREMVVSGDWLTPHLNGLPYFEKPPLVYWIEATTISLAGVGSAFWLRLPIALFALLGCLMLYGFCQRLGLRQEGFWAPLVLGTSILYCVLARLIILDLAFTVFMSAGLLAFFLSTIEQKKRLVYLGLYGAALALATLTKGLIGVFLPGSIILLWIALTRQWGLLKNAFHPLSLVVFSGIAVPWHIAVGLKNPEFWSFYFIYEHVTRYLTTAHNRHQPVWFFIPVLLAGFFPWVVFLPESLRLTRQKQLGLPQGLPSFLWTWVAFIFCFFSVSSSKLIPYILPVFPPLALLVASVLRQNPFPILSFKIYAGLAVLLGLGFLLYTPLDHQILRAVYDFKALAPLITGGIAFLWGGLWVIQRLYQTEPQKALSVLCASMIGFLLMLMMIDPHIQTAPSIRPLIRQLKPFVSDKTPIVLWGYYFQDVPVYLERTVHLAAHRGELDFGGRITPDQDRLLTDKSFQNLWTSQARVFLIARYRMSNPNGLRDLRHALPLHTEVLHCPPYMIATNHPLTPELERLSQNRPTPCPSPLTSGSHD
jgi:4-amino-4-deoxy-L-arabinose transferase-like glycosyltransferase